MEEPAVIVARTKTTKEKQWNNKSKSEGKVEGEGDIKVRGDFINLCMRIKGIKGVCANNAQEK